MSFPTYSFPSYPLPLDSPGVTSILATVNHVTYGNSALATLLNTTGVKLNATQGDVAFAGQVKITADVAGEGALHVVNESPAGYGLYVDGLDKAIYALEGIDGFLSGTVGGIAGTLQTIDALWAKIQKWLRLALRKDAATVTDCATELAEINANGGSGAGAYASTTDSQEALRDAVDVVDAILDAVVVDTGTDLPATLAAIKAKTDLLGTASVTVTSPAAATGDVTLYQGDDYHNSDSRSLEWTNAAGTWPDLTSATVVLGVRAPNGSSFTAAGSVVTPTGAGQKVRVELTAAQTALLVDWPTPSELRVRVTLASGRKVTLVDAELAAVVDIL